MKLSDIFYYFIAFSMMAGVQIALLLDINLDQKPNGGISISFGPSYFFSKAHREVMKEHSENGKILTPETLKSMSASFTKKISGGCDTQVDVGNSDKYLPTCRKHFY